MEIKKIIIFVTVLFTLLFTSILYALPTHSLESNCQKQIAAIPNKSTETSLWIKAATCLQQINENKNSPEINALAQSKLPDDKHWYFATLQQYRQRGEIAAALQIAYLLDLRNFSDLETCNVLAEFYAFAAHYHLSGKAYLQTLRLDPNQIGNISVNLENLIRTAAVEIEPALLLDSLHRDIAQDLTPKDLSALLVLENIGWQFRYYRGAMENFMHRLSLSMLKQDEIINEAQRFYNLGYDDYAALIFEKSSWEKLTGKAIAYPRLLFMRIHTQLKDYARLVTLYHSSLDKEDLLSEEQTLFAEALTRKGDNEEAITLAKKVVAQDITPWSFKANIIIARNQIAQHQLAQSQALLKKIKEDPRRQESSGSILFWQAFNFIHQRKYIAAESLLVLSAAYTGEAETELALQYRYYLLLDTSAAREAFFQGLSEAPWPPEQRRENLEKVPSHSELWPYAQFAKSEIFIEKRQLDSASIALQQIMQKSENPHATLKAQAKGVFLQERLSQAKQNVLAQYEELLIKYQQGVIPEFTRERLGRLRSLK